MNTSKLSFILLAMFWRSPELLTGSMPPSGTTKGDVYSFAIILQEIIYRCGPYETTGHLPMVPKGQRLLL